MGFKDSLLSFLVLQIKNGFQQMVLGNWISNHKRVKLDPYLIPVYKNHSKWIKDLNIRDKTIKF